jgi:hypothetical protein
MQNIGQSYQMTFPALSVANNPLLDTCIQHGHFVLLQAAMHKTQQIMPQPGFARVFGVHPFKGQWAGDSLIAILLGSLLAQEILNMRVLLTALVIVGAVVLINVSRRIKVRVRWP